MHLQIFGDDAFLNTKMWHSLELKGEGVGGGGLLKKNPLPEKQNNHNK